MAPSDGSGAYCRADTLGVIHQGTVLATLSGARFLDAKTAACRIHGLRLRDGAGAERGEARGEPGDGRVRPAESVKFAAGSRVQVRSNLVMW